MTGLSAFTFNLLVSAAKDQRTVLMSARNRRGETDATSTSNVPVSDGVIPCPTPDQKAGSHAEGK